MDARLDIYRILGLNEGDAHVIRNAGGVVTDDAVRSLAISQRLLGTRKIFLIHHTDCGMPTSVDSPHHRQPVHSAHRGGRGFIFDVATGRLKEVA